MSGDEAVKGRAAFHLIHNEPGHGTRRDRAALLREAARHLDSMWAKRQAKRNDSIVTADTGKNRLWVHGEDGGWVVATGVHQALDYGDGRLGSVFRKMNETQKVWGSFVVHLPATMCEVLPDFYGPGRHRNIARDDAEAKRYFSDAVNYLAAKVVPGGAAGIHAIALNLDETTPHIQIMTDPFVDDPKHPGKLKTAYSQAYGNEAGRDGGSRRDGSDKLSGYQAGMRAWMVERGYPVEEEAGPRKGFHRKDVYAARREVERAAKVNAEAEALRADAEAVKADIDKTRAGVKAHLSAQIEANQATIDQERAAWESQRQRERAELEEELARRQQEVSERLQRANGVVEVVQSAAVEPLVARFFKENPGAAKEFAQFRADFNASVASAKKMLAEHPQEQAGPSSTGYGHER